jgi:hypothetical protein
MKRIIHIIRKDAKFLRIFWVLWVLLIAAQVGLAAMLGGAGAASRSAYAGPVGGLAAAVAVVAALEYAFRRSPALRVVLAALRIGAAATLVAVAIGFAPSPLGPYQFETLLLYFNAVGAAWMALAYLLSAAVILQDSPVGTKMFWATRPISGGALLGSKVLTLFLFLVVPPALVWLPWRIHSGFIPADLLTESALSMAWAAAAVVPAVVLATLAGTGPRFMLYNVVGFVAVLTLGLVMAARSAVAGPSVTTVTLGWGALVAALLAATAVITQFRSRLWALSMGQFLLGIALGLVVGACVPADASVRLPGPSIPAAFGSGIQVTSADLRLETRPGQTSLLTLQVGLRGIPDEVGWGAGRGVLEVRSADGTEVALSEVALKPIYNANRHAQAVARALGVPAFSEDPETKAWTRASEIARLSAANTKRAEEGKPPFPVPGQNGGVSRHPDYAGTIALAPETAKTLGAPGTSIRVHLTIGFARPQVLFELPIEGGQRRASGGLSVRVLKARIFRPEKRPEPGAAPNPWMDAAVNVDRPTFADLELFEIERGTPGGVVEIGRNGSLTFVNSSTLFEHVDILYISIPEPRVWRTDHWVELPDWMQTTRLAAVRFEPAGFVDRDVENLAVQAPVFPTGIPASGP